MPTDLPDDKGSPLEEGFYQEFTPILGWGRLYHLQKDSENNGFTASDFNNKRIIKIPSQKPSQYFRKVDEKKYIEWIQSFEKSSEQV